MEYISGQVVGGQHFLEVMNQTYEHVETFKHRVDLFFRVQRFKGSEVQRLRV